jgi:hypothetical protein
LVEDDDVEQAVIPIEDQPPRRTCRPRLRHAYASLIKHRNTAPTGAVTIGNTRQNGVRRLIAYCYGSGCYHQAVIDVEGWRDDIEIPSIGSRLRCQT